MIKKAAALSVILITLCVSAMAQDLKDPKVIISKAKTALLGFNSYGYTLEKEGWDFDMASTADATQNLSGEAGGNAITKKFVKEVDEVDASKPQWMTYTSEIMYLAPWTLRMRIANSDYVPDILQTAVMRYEYPSEELKQKKKKKADNMINNWSIKTKVLPVGIPRGIETESGNFLYCNWQVSHIYIENLAKDIAPVLEGVVDFNGRKAYKIGFHFTDAVKPKTVKADLKAWKIPSELHSRIEPELMWFRDNIANFNDVYYYIDAKDFTLLKEEVLLKPELKKSLAEGNIIDAEQKKQLAKSGNLYYSKEWKNIRLNDITEKEITK